MLKQWESCLLFIFKVYIGIKSELWYKFSILGFTGINIAVNMHMNAEYSIEN